MAGRFVRIGRLRNGSRNSVLFLESDRRERRYRRRRRANDFALRRGVLLQSGQSLVGRSIESRGVESTPVARTDEILGERRAAIGHQRRGSTAHQEDLDRRHRLHHHVGKRYVTIRPRFRHRSYFPEIVVALALPAELFPGVELHVRGMLRHYGEATGL